MSHSASASVHLRANWSSVRFRCKESRSPVKTLSSLSQSLHCSWAGSFMLFLFFLQWCSKQLNLLLRKNKVMHQVVMHPNAQLCLSGWRAPGEWWNQMFPYSCDMLSGLLWSVRTTVFRKWCSIGWSQLEKLRVFENQSLITMVRSRPISL